VTADSATPVDESDPSISAPEAAPESKGAFFDVDGDLLIPDPVLASGPWRNDQLHGRLVVGLFARALERAPTLRGYRCVRLTADLFRVAPLRPVSLSFSPLREGRRLHVVDIVMSAGGIALARATAALQRSTFAPPGSIWGPPSWSVPSPDDLQPQVPQSDAGRTYELRLITPIPAVGEGTKVWTRETYPLVTSERVSPFVRVALAADLSSPLSAWSDAGLRYVNSDVTIHLHRPPHREWVGLEVTNHLSGDGSAIGSCRIYDELGPLGWTSVCALAVEGAALPNASSTGSRSSPRRETP
jgi:hypothetical protein